jgi:hypothetical protein
VQAALARSAQPRMPERGAAAARVLPPPPPVVFRAAKPMPMPPHPRAPQVALQPKGVPLPVRPLAPHVQAALGRNAQAKLAPGGAATPRRAPAPPPVFAPHAAPRVVQRSTQVVESVEPLPKNILGMNRDGDTVKTAGGTWTAARYVALRRFNHGPCHGAHIKLAFTPEHPVNATKIALVQTVTVAKNERMYYGNETIKARSVVGTSIDQDEESRSPLYIDALGGGDALGSSDVQEGAGEHGHRYLAGENWQVKAASLSDTPHLRDVGTFSFQVFETTALAVAGVDAGTYYGSVKWGWWQKSDGDVLLVPLRVLSFGSVTDEFKTSLAKWNETPTSKGETPQQLPVAL